VNGVELFEHFIDEGARVYRASLIRDGAELMGIIISIDDRRLEHDGMDVYEAGVAVNVPWEQATEIERADLIRVTSPGPHQGVTFKVDVKPKSYGLDVVGLVCIVVGE